MAIAQSSRFLTLIQREFREHKTSLFWTPIISAALLALVMLGSVVLANRLEFLGSAILEALMREGGNGVNITISVNEDTGEEVTIVEVEDVDPETGIPNGVSEQIARIEQSVENGVTTQRIILNEEPMVEAPTPPVAPISPSTYEVLSEDAIPAEQWEFSRAWTFNPDTGNGGRDDSELSDLRGSELNVMLGVVHAILILILLICTLNYLLSTLYDDRKDRSILFWRSMPVSEWEIVLSKFVVALIVAPVIYIAISLLLQLAYVILMMILVWRMDQDPSEVVLGNIDFIALMIDPISGWLMTALLIAPTYAWLLCASALARRSPFLMAIVPVIGLFILEGLFFGTEMIGDAVQNHLPHLSDGSAVGFYLFGPDWTRVDMLSVAGGLVFAAVALAAAVWLRQHRWELK